MTDLFWLTVISLLNILIYDLDLIEFKIDFYDKYSVYQFLVFSTTIEK